MEHLFNASEVTQTGIELSGNARVCEIPSCLFLPKLQQLIKNDIEKLEHPPWHGFNVDRHYEGLQLVGWDEVLNFQSNTNPITYSLNSNDCLLVSEIGESINTAHLAGGTIDQWENDLVCRIEDNPNKDYLLGNAKQKGNVGTRKYYTSVYDGLPNVHFIPITPTSENSLAIMTNKDQRCIYYSYYSFKEAEWLGLFRNIVKTNLVLKD